MENIDRENTQQENTQQENTQQENTQPIQLAEPREINNKIAELERQYRKIVEQENR